jgi:exosome complex component RRP41
METRLHVDRFEEIFRLATDAGLVLHEEMKAAIMGRSRTLMNSVDSERRGHGTGEAGMDEFD